MSENHIIINVGRQLGSGGRTIGQMLAKDLGCEFYDREILNLAAKESGFSEKVFEQNDEHKRFFKALFQPHSQHVNDGNFYTNRLSQESLFQFQAEAIRHAASSSSCVFVGRCADYILRDFDDVINIFITADLEERAARVAERHQCDHNKALHIINQKEGSRASFYNYYTGRKWGDSANYDLCINSSLLGIEGTEHFIAQFIKQRLEVRGER